MWSLLDKIKVLALLWAKENATCSLPHLENERQQIVNDFWPSIMVNQNAM